VPKKADSIFLWKAVLCAVCDVDLDAAQISALFGG
jgi:hypothetical protein